VRLFELIHPGYPPIPQAIWHDWRKDYDIAQAAALPEILPIVLF